MPPSLRLLPLLPTLLLFAAGGCQSLSRPKQAPVSETPKVKVEADWHADGMDPARVEQIKRERQEAVQRVLEERENFGRPPEAVMNPPQGASYSEPVGTALTPAVHPYTADLILPEPVSPSARTANEPASFAGEPLESFHNTNRTVSTRVQPAPAANRGSATIRPGREEARPETVSPPGRTEAEWGLRLQGTLLGRNQEPVALVRIDGRDSLTVREGDVIEVELAEGLVPLRVERIDDNSIQVRLGNSQTLKTIR